MTDPVEKARIPFKIFDIIEQHPREAPAQQSFAPILPGTYQSEVLIDTKKAKGYIATQCARIHSKSYMQLGKEFTYQDTNGMSKPYRPSDLRYDLKHGFLQLRQAVHHITHQENMLHHDMYQNMMQEVFLAQIQSGSDPLNEKEALASAQASDWMDAMQVELDGLAALDCWDYVDASTVPSNEKIYHGKFVYKYKSPQNNMPGRYKARWCISDPKWLQRLSDVDCFAETVRVETIRTLLSKAVERN